MAQITIFDVTKFFVPIFCGGWAAPLAIHHFGPYHPIGRHPTLLYNAAGHQPIFNGALGFAGVYGLVFLVWKCFVRLVCHLDENRRRRLGLGAGPDPQQAAPEQGGDPR